MSEPVPYCSRQCPNHRYTLGINSTGKRGHHYCTHPRAKDKAPVDCLYTGESFVFVRYQDARRSPKWCPLRKEEAR